MSVQEKEIGFILTEFSTVLENVFSNFSARQLCTMSSVCKSWKRTAILIQRKRKFITTRLYEFDPDDDEEISKKLSSYINQLRQYPKAMIAYTTDCAEPSRNTSKESQKLFDNIIKLLPSDCMFIGCTTGGCLADIENNHMTGHVIKEIQSADNEFGVSLLTFPDIAGVKLSSFMLTCSQVKLISRIGTTINDIKSTIGIDDDHNEVKLILLHVCFSPTNVWKAMCGLRKAFPSAQIIGGRLEQVQLGKRSCTKGICGFVISGKVKATTVVEKQAEQKAFDTCLSSLIFHDQIPRSLSCESSLIFMIICAARGKAHYGKENVESMAVRKQFPTTPVFGMFSYGEIGLGNCHGNSIPESDDYLHTHTTVLSLCKFGL